MTFADDAALEAHVRALLAATLPKARWTHQGHLAATAGLILLHPEMPLDTALPELIRRLNDSHGVPNSDTRGYHATITIFFLAAIRHYLSRHDTTRPAHEQVNALLDGPLGAGKAVMGAYWSDGVLYSAEARRHWVPPDIKPIPYAIGG